MRLVSTIINGYNDMEDQNDFWGDFHTLLMVKVYFRITFAKSLSGMTDYKKLSGTTVGKVISKRDPYQ